MDTVGENAYGAAIQSHPNCVVTINLNRLKTFGGRWSRPFPSEVPEGLNILPEAFDDGPLAEDDVPPTSYVERLTIGDEETALSGDFFGLDELPGLLAIGEGGGEHFEGEERARLEGGDASANGEGERFYAGEHERFLVKEGGRTRFFEEDLRFWDGDAPSLFILLGDGEHSVLGR
ncbi:hypothetical protein PC117_g8847 [Phytophthora cactorum]|uniref:Uncharacterized protein n=1 Tax=Phytophthora cactorum TaxID=29920 RepID=A0A8T1DVQ5_9STRA|nr:hypothetical protein PC117_g8847 [Phytophthora cactorum]